MTRSKRPMKDAQRAVAKTLTETDLYQQRMGNNQLQGDDQESVRNERHVVPEANKNAEGVIESFENMDPKTRSERANGNGA